MFIQRFGQVEAGVHRGVREARKELRPTCISAVSTQLTKCFGLGERPNHADSELELVPARKELGLGWFRSSSSQREQKERMIGEAAKKTYF